MTYPELLFDDEWLVPRLRDRAQVAMPYCPYSGYPVRAAVGVRWHEDVFFYHGANYEVVSFNQTMHAEHSAITAALNDREDDNVRVIEVLYVETRDGAAPCGHCRQIINEYSSFPNIPVFVGNTTTGEVKKHLSGALLPHAFDVNSLA